MTDAPQLPAPDGSTDPWQWLEDVTGEEALAWVRERNTESEQELDVVPDPIGDGSTPLSEALFTDILAILDAKDRIPAVTMRGEHLYNLWKDVDHEHGLWRRTTLESFRTEDPEWEILLDIDALNEAEGENWVWHGATLLRPPEGEPYRRALVDLSRGGSDADVSREFDLETLRFVPESEGGFVRPEAKGGLSWIDEDTVFAATDFGEDTLTTSGYARQARLWRRGTPLTEAELVFEAAPTDMAVFAAHDSTPGWERDWVIQAHAFYDMSVHLLDREQQPPALTTLDVPRDLEANAHRDLGVFSPRSEWTVGEDTFSPGSLVVGDFASFLAGEPELHTLFEPTSSAALAGMTITRNTIVLTILEDVVHRLEVHYRADDGSWQSRDLFPDLTGAISVAAVDADEDDRIWLTVEDFTRPTTLLLADLAPVPGGLEPEEPEVIKVARSHFDAEGLEVTQHFATSEDGTRIPYFEIGAAGAETDGPAPTLLYGYGGFEISMTPSYLASIGKVWCERGGRYVLANIRGGGEYGPRWHQAALRENRHRAYEDFAGVARDLVERGVTDAAHLAVRGGSNGGLLTGNMVTQYPDLFGAVIVQVPLLDMKRFSHLLAGASWMAEYGDPDTDDWEFVRTFSPYHLLREDAEYPPTFLLTSTRDDRVHPGHARKFTAAMHSLGADVRSWENIEGGHGGAATNEQAARMNALMYTFLWNTVGKGHATRVDADTARGGPDALDDFVAAADQQAEAEAAATAATAAAATGSAGATGETRTEPPLVADELATTAGFLDYLRATVEAKARGLSDEQGARRLVDSLTTVTGIVRHLADVERYWFGQVLGGIPEEEVGIRWMRDEDEDAEFRIGPEDSLEETLDDYRAACESSRLQLKGRSGDEELTATGSPRTVRWVATHMVEETARHLGHLDLLAEMLDGRTGE